MVYSNFLQGAFSFFFVAFPFVEYLREEEGSHAWAAGRTLSLLFLSRMDELKKAQLSFLARYEKKGPPPTAAPRPTPVPPKPAPALAPAPPKPAPAQARPEALLTDQRLLYDIINYLKEVDRAVTIEEITSGTGIDVLSNSELLESLKTNPKVGIVEGRWYSFKPTYDITNKQELWSLIAETPQGIESSELKDSYKNIVQDVRVGQTLVKVLLCAH